MLRKFTLSLCLTLFSLVQGLSQDSIRVSLLTCSPGQEVYSLYGHTAIRCEQPSSHLDAVFNYGVFDFSKPYFMWRFVLGQTDYMVQPIPWRYFLSEYRQRGSRVTAQYLNLTQREAAVLTNRLIENSRPENCVYRYNFLYNNCTTMVRDMVERAVEGRIQYPDTLPHLTYRQILHQYTSGHPWAQEGDDILLGADVDTILSERAAMFAPEVMMHYFDGAFICAINGDQRPLVSRKEILVEERPVAAEQEFPLSPVQAMLCFATVCLLIMFLEHLLRRFFWIWDVFLLLLQGTAGSLITFMFLFSEHPAVGSNWQIWVLNPIALMGMYFVTKAAIQHRRTLWFAFQFAVLALFLLFSPWIPQVFGKIIVPLALCLLTRPLSYYIHQHRKNTQK